MAGTEAKAAPGAAACPEATAERVEEAELRKLPAAAMGGNGGQGGTGRRGGSGSGWNSIGVLVGPGSNPEVHDKEFQIGLPGAGGSDAAIGVAQDVSPRGARGFGACVRDAIIGAAVCGIRSGSRFSERRETGQALEIQGKERESRPVRETLL